MQQQMRLWRQHCECFNVPQLVRSPTGFASGAGESSSRLEKKLVKLLALVAITSSLQRDDLTYTEGNISRQNDPTAAAFGRDVKRAYQAHGSRRDLC